MEIDRSHMMGTPTHYVVCFRGEDGLRKCVKDLDGESLRFLSKDDAEECLLNLADSATRDYWVRGVWNAETAKTAV